MNRPFGDFAATPGIRTNQELPTFDKIPFYITNSASQNATLARVYKAQEEIMGIISLVGTIPTPEILQASEHLHVCIENLEVHIRNMKGRHTDDSSDS